MKFYPEQYKIKDQRMKPFINPEEIWDYINKTESTKERVREVIAKSCLRVYLFIGLLVKL